MLNFFLVEVVTFFVLVGVILLWALLYVTGKAKKRQIKSALQKWEEGMAGLPADIVEACSDVAYVMQAQTVEERQKRVNEVRTRKGLPAIELKAYAAKGVEDVRWLVGDRVSLCPSESIGGETRGG